MPRERRDRLGRRAFPCRRPRRRPGPRSGPPARRKALASKSSHCRLDAVPDDGIAGHVDALLPVDRVRHPPSEGGIEVVAPKTVVAPSGEDAQPNSRRAAPRWRRGCRRRSRTPPPRPSRRRAPHPSRHPARSRLRDDPDHLQASPPSAAHHGLAHGHRGHHRHGEDGLGDLCCRSRPPPAPAGDGALARALH